MTPAHPDEMERMPDIPDYRLTDAEKRLRDWLMQHPEGGEMWCTVKGGFRRSYELGKTEERFMQEAYRPEVVAEVAVHLGSHEDWEELARWTGGRIGGYQDQSGEWTSYLDLPNGERGGEWAWLVLNHAGEFHFRAEVQAPDVVLPPGNTRGDEG